ncbi:MAG TPA: hypothetical protein PK264_13150 [Hyphomicrobiaceae bacterium]|nr:hypothetical protein [Hyphomicrobiaceae bacterium]
MWRMRWPPVPQLVAAIGVVASVGAAECAVRFKRNSGMVAPPPATAAECERGGRVHVVVSEEAECVAYHAGAPLYGARKVVLFLDGDLPLPYQRSASLQRDYLKRMLEILQILSRRSSGEVPFVLLARPGTFGSTGDHGKRRTEREIDVLNAAIDRLKARYRVVSWVIAGQSGGATSLAGLLIRGRRDIECAIPGSGAFDYFGALAAWNELHGDEPLTSDKFVAYRDRFHAMDNLDRIPRDPRRRIFVVGDPEDRVTPFRFQETFQKSVAAAGHHAVLVPTLGAGEERHGVTYTVLRLAALCADGASDGTIERAAPRPR